MSDSPGIPHRQVQIKHVQVAGDDILAVIIDGEGVAIPIRLVCDALGVSPQQHSERLREHDVLAQGLRIVRVPLAGRVQSVLAILHTHIAFWLANVLPQDVRADVRPKLVQYQEELVLVLHALYGPHLLTETAATPPPASADLLREIHALRETLMHIVADQQQMHARLIAVEDVVEDLRQIARSSAAQAAYLQRAIKRLATCYHQRYPQERNPYERLFAQFKLDMRIPRYDALPMSQYLEVLTWLQQQAATYLPDDPEALPPHQEQLL